MHIDLQSIACSQGGCTMFRTLDDPTCSEHSGAMHRLSCWDTEKLVQEAMQREFAVYYTDAEVNLFNRHISKMQAEFGIGEYDSIIKGSLGIEKEHKYFTTTQADKLSTTVNNNSKLNNIAQFTIDRCIMSCTMCPWNLKVNRYGSCSDEPKSKAAFDVAIKKVQKNLCVL